jgi:UDP-GlcNAc:undecaprenyl-phosphate GlcNAc-1-phosphate transferase
MSFPFTVYVLAFVGAWLTTSLAMPFWMRWCRNAGLVDAPGQRKIHDRPVPLAGGLAVLTGLLVPLLVGALATHLPVWDERAASGSEAVSLLGYGFARRAAQLAVIVVGAIGMVVVGVLDDRLELRPLPKFVGQLFIAVLVASAGIRITLFVNSIVFSYAVTILWILTVTNACNFLDNMNGLCAGLGLIGSWCFAWIAAMDGQYLVASTALLTGGALLGFLPYNFPRAAAFLGDAGSHLIGYLLAILAILPHFYSRRNPDAVAVLKPLFILGVFLGDLVWVVVLRWRLGRPVYVGDNNHVSHRLVRCGLSQTRTVLMIWLCSAILGWIAFRL